MCEKGISIDEIKTIRQKNGNEGLTSHIFLWFHKNISSKMDNKDLKVYLAKAKNECGKDAFLFIKDLVDLEEEFRATRKDFNEWVEQEKVYK